jgi:hypothetical protein
MPKLARPHKFQLCLSAKEWQMAESMAKKEQLTRSELFRLKTLYKKLPRRITKITALTYWQLAKIGNNLNQIAKALNTTNKIGRSANVSLLLDLHSLLNQNLEMLTQVRRELVELDLLEPLEEDEREGTGDDWETS